MQGQTNDGVQEVEAEVINPPVQRTGIDELVSEAESLERKIESGETYLPREIKSLDDYGDAKRERKALRKEIKAIEEARRDMFAKLDEQKRRIGDALKPAKNAEAEYKRCLDDYKQGLIANRQAEVERWYSEEYAPAMAALVPFGTIRDKYAAKLKWGNETTGTETMKKQLAEDVLPGIKRDLDLIDAQSYEPQDKQRLRQVYCDTLDFAAAAQQVQHEREQRERMEKLERERAELAAEQERMRQEAMAQQEADAQRLADAAQSPSETATATQAPAASSHPQAREKAETAASEGRKTFAFTGYGPASELNNLIAYCKAHGIHGKARWL